MIVYTRMMSGKVKSFFLDDFYIYKVKKLRYMLSIELRELHQKIKIFKDEEPVDDSELLLEGEEYCVFVDI